MFIKNVHLFITYLKIYFKIHFLKIKEPNQTIRFFFLVETVGLEPTTACL